MILRGVGGGRMRGKGVFECIFFVKSLEGGYATLSRRSTIVVKIKIKKKRKVPKIKKREKKKFSR